MVDNKSVFVERDINPYHCLLASFFAGLAEMGMANQGSINIASRRAAEFLYDYLDAKGLLTELKKFDDVTTMESIGYHSQFINSLLNIMGKYDVIIVSEDEYTLQIDGNMCRICPTTVGGADIKGSLCPIPFFLEKMINLLSGQEVLELQTAGIKKDGTNCLTSFKIKR